MVHTAGLGGHKVALSAVEATGYLVLTANSPWAEWCPLNSFIMLPVLERFDADY